MKAWLNSPPSGGGAVGPVWIPLGQIASGVGDPGNQIQFADLDGDGRDEYIDVAPDSSVTAWYNGGHS